LFSYAGIRAFALVQRFDISSGHLALPCLHYLPAVRQPRRQLPLRNYVMLPAAIEQERLFVAERLLFEIERRHGLPHPANRDIHPVIVDRFLTAYVPETRDGEPAPSAVEFAFARSLTEALQVVQGVVSETDTGFGAALYVHDLDTGNGGPAGRESTAAGADARS
jgi:hypothetical protein